MKIQSLYAPFNAVFACFLLTSQVQAEGLNLSSGNIDVVDENSISLHNIAVNNNFYNAQIQLNLDGTYQVESVQQLNIAPTARYEVVFSSSWTADTHPYQFPSGSAHFSGLIGATHNNDIRLWQRDEQASAGIEQMAETGGKSALSNEIQTAMNNATAETLISGSGIGSSPGSIMLEFEASQQFPFVSLVSMLAPSPDWFVGVSALNLIAQGQWRDEIIIPLFVYDAGTDDGINYTSQNSDSNPQGLITRLQQQPFLIETEIRSIGTFIFTRLGE